MIWAADGACRPFSDDASGTVAADGAAMVVLTARACARQCYARCVCICDVTVTSSSHGACYARCVCVYVMSL